MQNTQKINKNGNFFNKNANFFYRLKSMLKVDGTRTFTTPLFYIFAGIAFIVPILILVMTTMTGGSADGSNAASFENVWQIIGAVSTAAAVISTGSIVGGANAGGSIGAGAANSAGAMGAGAMGAGAGTMDLTSMCNINLLFFAVAVLVCLFISADFKSGYAKNLFTVRAKKSDYVASKIIICFIASAWLFIAFFFGAMVGGAIAGLSFETNGFTVANVIFCLLTKIFLTPIFISIFTLFSVIAKQKTWLSICLSLGGGMLLFMMIPMLAPLNASLLNALFCLAGSSVFALGLGAISTIVLNKTALV